MAIQYCITPHLFLKECGGVYGVRGTHNRNAHLEIGARKKGNIKHQFCSNGTSFLYVSDRSLYKILFHAHSTYWAE